MLMEQVQNHRYVYVLERNGDISVWKGIAQDALIMNIEFTCVGATDIFTFVNNRK
jgi:hypothetical protein